DVSAVVDSGLEPACAALFGLCIHQQTAGIDDSKLRGSMAIRSSGHSLFPGSATLFAKKTVADGGGDFDRRAGGVGDRKFLPTVSDFRAVCQRHRLPRGGLDFLGGKPPAGNARGPFAGPGVLRVGTAGNGVRDFPSAAAGLALRVPPRVVISGGL